MFIGKSVNEVARGVERALEGQMDVDEEFQRQAQLLDQKAKQNESPQKFGERLEKLGARELVVRKALGREFGLSIAEAVEVGSTLSESRAREVETLLAAYPERSDYSKMKSIARTFEITNEEVLALIAAVEEEPER